MTTKDIFYRVGVDTGEGCLSYNGYCYRSQELAEAAGRDLLSRWTMARDFVVEAIGPEIVRDKMLTIRDEPLIKGAGHRVQL